VLVAVLCVAASCLLQAMTLALAQTSPVPALDIELGVDPQVRPGDDFFAYANGDWLREARIPTGQGRWSGRHEIDARTRAQLAAVQAEAASAPAGTEGRLLADYEAALLNTAAIEARGLQPVQPQLRAIAALSSKADLVRHLGRQLRADVDPLNWGVTTSPGLFGLAVQRGIHGEAGHFAYLLQGGLGLPGRAAYLAETDSARAQRLAYREHIARTLALAGQQPARRRADAVLALETALARSHADEAASASERNAEHLWSRAEFQARAPGMDWNLFFDAAGLSRQQAVVAWQPAAIAGQAALLMQLPLGVWKDHLRFHLLDQRAACLPRAFAEQAAVFREVQLGGQPQPAPRAQRAQALAAQALPEALGRLYVQRYFPPELKARVQTIARNVAAAFARRVEAVPWLSPDSKAMALAKLQVVSFGLGYPDKWTDYSGLRIDPADACGNQQRLADWTYQRALARLSQPADPTAWVMAPHTVAAILLPLSNSYNFAAALLQPPKFDPAAPDAANYGAIGAIVGHELSHFVDTLGADYDASGAMRSWWTAQDRAGYGALATALSQQFASYQPLPGLRIDGPRTESENVADLGGLAAAFDAYRATLGSEAAADPAALRRQDRQFFIGYARSWRSQLSESALRTQLAQDNHAPERYRIATVRNLDAWYRAFDVQPGQALYLPPQARLRVW
jgi:putative endopeptidase